MKRSLAGIMVFLLAFHNLLYAQEHAGSPVNQDSAKMIEKDTTTLASAFKQGQLKGNIRYFFMATDNKKGLTDYYAHALGGGLRYETGNFHGFQLAAGIYTILNMGSSDMTQPDPVTGQFNRYEIALYDLEHPGKKKDMNRLEEAYLKYNFKGSKVILGRQLINTPFINLQDGRIRPTAVEGLWVEWNEFKGLKIEGGWIYAISPRGTTAWHKTGNSIGLYPVGMNVKGTKSQYYQAVETNGVAIAGITKKINNIKLQAWDLVTENVFNTAMLQADLQLSLKERSTVYAAAQFIRQDAINNGGNDNPEKRYFQKDGKAITFGASAGWKNKQWEANINYNRITAHGRYLMPREWGRDPFFTFMPRERNEGFGDVHAFMAKINYHIPQTKLKTSLSGGYFNLPQTNNFRLNKYVVPSYTQVNFDTKYSFEKIFKGLDAQLLVVGKFSDVKELNNNAIFNKVDMLHYNFILNYHF
ncbi:MAG TPA: OprD family outer membrane porin [Sphingobacteriaceae bacterium]